MTADIAVLDRAVVVMAICMALQTVLFVGAAIAGFIAWRRASEALVEARGAAQAQVAELRAHLEHMSARVDDVSDALVKGTAAVDDVVTDMREAMGTVRNSVGTVASAVTGPRAALAVGLLRGFQMWRKRRAGQTVTTAATSEL